MKKKTSYNLSRKISFVLSAALFAAVGSKVMAERDTIDLLDAAEENNPALASYLIEQGADLEKRSYFFSLTPLTVAFQNGASEVATVLICAGADLYPHDTWSNNVSSKGAALKSFAEQSVKGAKIYLAASGDEDSFKENYCPAYSDDKKKSDPPPFARYNAEKSKPAAAFM